jgi:hypothetical protein
VYLIGELQAITREPDRFHGGELVHDAHQIGRTESRPHKRG